MKRLLLACLLSCATVGQISCDSSVIAGEQVLANVSKGTLNTMTHCARNGLIGLSLGLILAERPLRWALFFTVCTALCDASDGVLDIHNASNFNESDTVSPAQKKAVLRGWYGAGKVLGMFTTLAALNAMFKA